MARNPSSVNHIGAVIRSDEEIRQLRLREIPAALRTEIVEINEGFIVDDPYLAFTIALGRVYWSGTAYWDTPGAYSPSAAPLDPADNAINIFSGGSTDAFGGSDFDNALIPAAARPKVNMKVLLHSLPNSGDRGFYDVTYETLVTPGGAWSIQTVTAGGSTYPVNADGLTHRTGIAMGQTLLFDGASWDV